MSEVIQPDWSNVSRSEKPPEFSLHVPLSQGRSGARTENQIVLYLASSVLRERLQAPKTGQGLQHEILKLDDPATTLSLCVVEDPACLRMQDGSTNARGAALPIDVAPLERQVFTGPHPSGQRQRVQGKPLRF